MSLINKLLYGNTKFYKLYVNCNDKTHGGVFVIKTKYSEDEIKSKDSEIKTKIGNGYTECSKCVTDYDLLTVEEYKRARKVYREIEV